MGDARFAGVLLRAPNHRMTAHLLDVAGDTDLRLQAEHSFAEFDYLDRALPASSTRHIVAITAAGAVLDYGLLELDGPDRPPRRLSSEQPTADPANAAAVNPALRPSIQRRRR